MIIVISPAKTLDFKEKDSNLPMSEPRFLDKSQEIINEISNYDCYSLEKLMKISTKLAILNVDRFQKWTKDLDTAKQALLAFKGEVFRGMDVGSLSHSELFYANEHLRILSGLYGVLRPFDGINEYRLEMGTKLKVNGLKDLYEFWGTTLEESIIEELKNHKDKTIINLASNEYFTAIEGLRKNPNVKVITPIFKELRGDQYKIISFNAKKARGIMSRYIIQNEIEDIEELKKLDVDGYLYNEEMSTEKDLVFIKEK
ncbi:MULTISPECIES: peroxide stress protein YaaA [unclassified Clostridium]|uniref:peroxide stress protein YaaA n=1 Tax=unclassified Clostridium TaxID=2614128 RepID=UPI0025C3EFE8|nr:peroxide stress protein YaaA [Clostridium sp.]MCI6691267.1 peroxide stress protein YaaA [Clostridium sp.]MDY4252324.1 peroxide stress protein YaaA [Clostridium sp.]